MNRKSIEPLSFEVPRREAREYFQSDLYPDTVSSLPALSNEKWFQGDNASPKLERVSESYFKSSQKPTRITTEKQIQGSAVSTTDHVLEADSWNSGSGWGSSVVTPPSPPKIVEPIPAPKPVQVLSEKPQKLGKLQKNKVRESRDISSGVN